MIFNKAKVLSVFRNYKHWNNEPAFKYVYHLTTDIIIQYKGNNNILSYQIPKDDVSIMISLLDELCNEGKLIYTGIGLGGERTYALKAPNIEQQVLGIVYIDWTVKEIAHRLNMSQPAVRSILNKLRRDEKVIRVYQRFKSKADWYIGSKTKIYNKTISKVERITKILDKGNIPYTFDKRGLTMLKFDIEKYGVKDMFTVYRSKGSDKYFWSYFTNAASAYTGGGAPGSSGLGSLDNMYDVVLDTLNKGKRKNKIN